LLVSGTRQNVVPHINKDLTPCDLFIFYSTVTITLWVKETSCYYQQYLDFLIMDLLMYLMSLNLKCFCFWQLLFR
jgi:hypothetical protein